MQAACIEDVGRRRTARVDFPDIYSTSEQLFFLGAPVAHIVAFEEEMRENRRRHVIASSRRQNRRISAAALQF